MIKAGRALFYLRAFAIALFFAFAFALSCPCAPIFAHFLSGQVEQDRQNETGRKGQAERDWQNRIGIQNRQNVTGETGLAERDRQARTARTGSP
jgi:hypothetical protein